MFYIIELISIIWDYRRNGIIGVTNLFCQDTLIKNLKKKGLIENPTKIF